MFWIVQIAAVVATLVLLYVFRKENKNITLKDKTIVKDYFPSYLLVGMVLALILASFIPNNLTLGSFEFNKPSTINGIICMGALVIGVIVEVVKYRSIRIFSNTLKEIDYFTLLLLSGLFIVISGITEAGVIDEISKLFVKVSNNNLFLIYTLIVWASVLFSAFIDNIPYVATMLPVVTGIADILGIDPTILYFGLLSGATLGGNITPIGASANIAGLGILRREGYEVSAKEFMKISVPFTLAAVTTGYVLIWLIWS